MTTRAEPRAHIAGYGKDLAALFDRVRYGDQRAAFCGRFDDHDAQSQTANDAVTPRKRPPIGLGPEGKFGDDCTVLADRTVKPAMTSGIDQTTSAPQPNTARVRLPAFSAAAWAARHQYRNQTADDAYTPLDETVR